MSTRPVRCRFAPSPTGALHVGGARTALFNYLFARANAGTFVLRIEDTDRERSTAESERTIFEALEWLKLSADEGPYFQTKRMDIYRDYAQRLLASGHAYACTCTAERLEQVREEQRARGEKPQYDRKHRPVGAIPQTLALPTGQDKEPFVIRLRVPEEGTVVMDDLILGPVETARSEIDDFVIVRSDGTPTYNFVVVVDDIEMQISHVIRGMDHVSNTPKQIVIYEALEAALPLFAHVPMILGPDKKKLSKRHGATSVTEYQQAGFLPDAFLNYLARLGWSYGDQEIFTRSELEKLFSLEAVGKSPAVFDQEKLMWVSAEHLKVAPLADLVAGVSYFLAQRSIDVSLLSKDKAFALLLDSLRERTRTLLEMADQCVWYFADDAALHYDEAAVKKHLNESIREPFSLLIEKLETLSDFSQASTEAVFHEVIEKFGIKLGKLAQACRVALTGTSVSPPIYTVLEILGKSRAMRRMRTGAEKIA